MKVIICEKPSQAKAVAKGLNLSKYDYDQGYYTNGEIYSTWCFGHLFERTNPEGKWAAANLPIVKQPTLNQVQFYTLKSDGGVKKQFKNIKSLVSKADEIICSTDPDGEGETIYREVVENLGVSKNQTRMWLKDLTEQGVVEAYGKRKDISEYEGLRQRAYGRSYFDWCFGLTMTQLTTLINNKLVNVGRVQTPTLKMIVDRYNENVNFKPETKYVVDVKLNDTDVVLKINNEVDFKNLDECNEYIASNPTLVVSKKETKQQSIKPPTIHNLASLQKWANANHNFSAKQTLDVLQKLYEDKLVSYPRTDCNKISQNTASKLNKIFNGEIKNVVGEVSAHEGLTPTTNYHEGLSGNEKIIYDEIFYTTQANYFESLNVNSKTIELHDQDKNIIWSGKVVENLNNENNFTNLEYYKYYKVSNVVDKNIYDLVESKLNNLSKQDYTLVSRDYQTKPKPLFTESGLISKMENIHNDIEDRELANISKVANGIGTPATRADIIQSLFTRGYVESKNKNIKPTQKGIDLIEVLTKLNNPLLSLDYSAKLEQLLSDVEDKKNLLEFIENINNNLKAYVSQHKDDIKQSPEDIICKCKCGDDVIKLSGQYGPYFKCKGCGITFSDHNFSNEEVRTIITGGSSDVKSEKSKKGKSYKATYSLVDKKLTPTFIN